MSFSLKNHPFGVEAFFDLSLVLTYAVQKSLLRSLVPACFELETSGGNDAFLAIAVVKTKSLRPKGFPEFLGNNFILVGYRVFVTYTNASGKRLRGLYILKSETDKKRMQLLGNIFTHYKYSTTDIQIDQHARFTEVSSLQSGLHIKVEESPAESVLPKSSPFGSWKEARRFAGPLPFTFNYDKETQQVLTVEGVRSNWIPKPVSVIAHELPYLRDLGVDSSAMLASAFKLQNIPYSWKKGTTALWNV